MKDELIENESKLRFEISHYYGLVYCKENNKVYLLDSEDAKGLQWHVIKLLDLIPFAAQIDVIVNGYVRKIKHDLIVPQSLIDLICMYYPLGKL